MINETIKHNWIQTALADWEARYQSGELPNKGKPNRQLLEGLIGLMFTQEKLLMSSATWVDLSSVTAENFFAPKSRELILRRTGNSLSGKADARKIAYECLQHAYEEGFDIADLMPRYQIAKSAAKPKPSAKKSSAKQPVEKTLAEAWEEAVFVVLKNEFKTPQKDLPKKAIIQSAIQHILSELQKEFGEVSYQQFIDDDNVIDKTEEILNSQITNPETDAAKLIAEALKVSAARLPLRP